MTCDWCGDSHTPSALCQRAQRGMTRRSFCFLFGAGVAGAFVPQLPGISGYYSPPANAYLTIVQHLYEPTELSFTSRDAAMRIGQKIKVALGAPFRFQGVVDRVEWRPDGSQNVHAISPVPVLLETSQSYEWTADSTKT